jgi:hypothetical protein
LNTGSITWNGGAAGSESAYAWKLDLNNAGTPNSVNTTPGGAGGAFDQIVAAGLSFAGSGFKLIIQSLNPGGNGAGAFDANQNYTWVIARTTATPISGFDAHAFVLDISGFTTVPGMFSLSTAADGSGSDLNLSYDVTATPEPGSITLLVGGMVGMLLRRRRR